MALALLANLPLELLEYIVILTSVQSAARLCQCSKQLRSIIQKDTHIWRSLYLQLWDDPRGSMRSIHENPWKGDVYEIMLARNVIMDQRLKHPHDVWSDEDAARKAYRKCAQILLRSRDSHRTMPAGAPRSRNIVWLEQVVGEYAIYTWPWLLFSIDFDCFSRDGDMLDNSVWTNDGFFIEDPKLSWVIDGLPPPEPEEADEDEESDPELRAPYLSHMAEKWRLISLAGYSPPPTPPEDPESSNAPLSDAALTRIAARAYVYDLRNYSEAQLWGPWTSEDSSPAANAKRHVNWKHVYSLMFVTLSNMAEASGRGQFRGVDAPIHYLNTMPFTAPGWGKRKPGDWAGVEGIWKRAISFMDYRDLVVYNFAALHGHDGPLNDSIFRDPDFGEAFRLLLVQLSIESIDDPSTPGLVDPTRPTIHFKGTSRGGAPNESNIRGSVSITPSGNIRWNIIDVYSEEITRAEQEDRWQSSGVQIGGTGSAFGIIGCWSPFEHESIRDPAGPFWMWKDK